MEMEIWKIMELTSVIEVVGRRLLKLLKERLEVEMLSPNVKTFNILVDALCKEGKIEEAENVIKLMPERDILPDLWTYNSLINGYCLQGEMSKARTIFDSMAFRYLIPDDGLFGLNVVKDAHISLPRCKHKVFSEEGYHRCEAVVSKDERESCWPDDTTYNVLLHGCLKNQQYDDVKMLLVEMDERGYLLGASTLSLLQSQNTAKTLEAKFAYELLGML
ncbi:tetratricopeptide repeat-like superfamily protein [Tanacetum coccineum]